MGCYLGLAGAIVDYILASHNVAHDSIRAYSERHWSNPAYVILFISWRRAPRHFIVQAPCGYNHRDVCKFDGLDDPNYLRVRDSLSTALEILLRNPRTEVNPGRRCLV
jgi:hypothetical protein